MSRMKIPQTATNVGAYYANEENGQWQPNGVIIDSGVGGGVVGSGDAGVHRPPVYPLHIPRGHLPAAYVMAGTYYPPAAPYPVQPPPPHDDFEDYMWMENEEEFDKQVMQQLEEEALMEQCIEAMLEDEQRERNRPAANGPTQYPTTSNGSGLSLEETVSRSTLNPLAAEFVPTGRLQPPPAEDRTDPVEVSVASETVKTAEETQIQSNVQENQDSVDAPEQKPEVLAESPTQETPEVSAADVHIDKDERPKEKDSKKDTKPKVEAKKTNVKPDARAKVKPQVVKSEPKVTQKKKEPTKSVKSEVKVEEKVELPVTETVKPQTNSEETPSTGFKPINYAAAARATKPKKPSSPPVDINPTTKQDKDKKPERKTEKPTPKPEKVTQRKNSMK